MLPGVAAIIHSCRNRRSPKHRAIRIHTRMWRKRKGRHGDRWRGVRHLRRAHRWTIRWKECHSSQGNHIWLPHEDEIEEYANFVDNFFWDKFVAPSLAYNEVRIIR
ncbi:hypothetical protein [Pseudoscardovia suis]